MPEKFMVQVSLENKSYKNYDKIILTDKFK